MFFIIWSIADGTSGRSQGHMSSRDKRHVSITESDSGTNNFKHILLMLVLIILIYQIIQLKSNLDNFIVTSKNNESKIIDHVISAPRNAKQSNRTQKIRLVP